MYTPVHFVPSVELPYARLQDDPSPLEPVAQWLAKMAASIRQAMDKGWKHLAESTHIILHDINQPLLQHPFLALFLALLVSLGPWLFILPLALLQAVFFIVFGTIGLLISFIIGGSPTDLFRAFCYGEHTPISSLFCALQSLGTMYDHLTVQAPAYFFVATRLLAAALATYVFFWIILV